MKKRIERLGAILLALVLLAGTLSAPAGAAATPHSHSLEGGSGASVTFTEWTSANSMPTTAGNYYLSTDVNHAGWTVPAGTVNLCLNGYKISSSSTIGIRVNSGAVLNICDCDGSRGTHTITSHVSNGEITIQGGLIQANKIWTNNDCTALHITGTGICNLYGGTIAGGGVADGVASRPAGGGAFIQGGTFNMYGGEIRDNQSRQGGAVRVASGAFNLYGGSIYNNAGWWGGGVSLAGGSANLYGGTFYNNMVGTSSDTPVRGVSEDIYVTSGGGSLSLYGSKAIDANIVLESQKTVQFAEPLHTGSAIKLYRKGVDNNTSYSVKVAEGAPGYSITDTDMAKVSRMVDTLYPNHEFWLKDDGLYLVIHQHSPSADWTSNETHHWHACTGDGTCGFPADHTGNDSYGAHAFTEYGDTKDEHGHYLKCATCGYVQTVQTPHSFTVTHDGTHHIQTCNACDYEVQNVHTYPGYTDQNNGTHSRTCTFPGCGYVDSGAHSYGNWTSTDTEHSHTCTACGHTEKLVHSYGGWVTTDGTNHWKVCAVCGYRGQMGSHTLVWQADAGSHWQECSVCGGRYGTAAHTASSAWVTADDDHHWHSCTQAGCPARLDEAAHAYTIQQSDDTHHWQECACGKRVDVTAHQWSDWKTDGTNHWKECSDCGRRTGEAAHSGDGSWHFDSAGHHYKICAVCGQRYERGTHQVDMTNKKYAVGDDPDVCYWYACTVCGWADPSTVQGHHFTDHRESDTEHWTECADPGCSVEINRALHTYSGGYSDGGAEHYKQCDGCTRTTDHGQHVDAAGHDANQHWQECTTCHRKTGQAAHDGGIAQTTGSGASHDVACSCGYVLRAEVHTWSYSNPGGDPDHHTRTCTACQYTDSTEAHEYAYHETTNGHIQRCAKCGHETAEAAHVPDGHYTNLNNATHTQACRHCGAALTETHTFGAAVDDGNGSHTRTCTACGHSVTEAHTYGGWTPVDDDKHSRTCAVCQAVEVKDHSFGPYSADAAGHSHTCGDCGKVVTAPHATSWVTTDGAQHWKECGVCKWEEPGTRSAHDFHEGTYHTDASRHWLVCDCGRKKDEAYHAYVQKSDGSGHWDECVCGRKINQESHSIPNRWKSGTDAAGAAIHWQECEVCGWQESRGSCNSAVGYWKDRADYHYQVCDTCGNEFDKGAHDRLGQGTDLQTHWLECGACGRKYPESEEYHQLTLKYNDTEHYEECGHCHTIVNETAHHYTQGHDANGHYDVCFCGHTTNREPHRLVYKFDPAQHWQECGDCGWEAPDRAGHVYVDDQDADCDTCGYQCYIVTFDSKGGSAVGLQRVPTVRGKAVRPANPTRGGYTFDGWCTDEGGATAWDFSNEVASSMTLYAKWRTNGGGGGGFTGGDGGFTGGGGTTGGGTTGGGTGGGDKTTIRDDGAKVTTGTRPDGGSTEKVELSDGTSSEVTKGKNGDVTIVVNGKSGEQVAKVEIPANLSGSSGWFVDLDPTPWAEAAINRMAELGVVQGVGDRKYSPTAPMTRGALATIIHRLSQGKTDYRSAFQDVADGQYYTQGVAWAAQVKVVAGYSEDRFGPEDTITREQLGVMLCRYAAFLGLYTKSDAKTLERFRDGGKTSGWAVEGVSWCVEKGILEGKGGNILDPGAQTTRAEVAVMFDRFIQLLRTQSMAQQ